MNTPNNKNDINAIDNTIDDNALNLATLLSKLDPALIDEALDSQTIPSGTPPSKHQRLTRLLLLTAALLLLFSFSSMVFALNTLQQQNQQFYLRLLSPQDIADLSLESAPVTETTPDPKRLFAALKSDNIYTQYIAINRLAELYNDPQLRSQAIQQLQPFLNSPDAHDGNSADPKLTEAAALVNDILSGQFKSPRLCHMADGSVFFTLFPDYSDYGSHNQLWRIQDGQLSSYVTFSEPYNYITQLLPSPDGKLLAVGLCSNKSSQLVIIDAINGYWSPELISSTRTLWPMTLGGDTGQSRRADCRIDNETYSNFRNLQWLDNNRLQYDADLAYNDNNTPDYSAVDICDSVCVTYDFAQNSYTFSDYQLNTY